jgi:hypothetical protein
MQGKTIGLFVALALLAALMAGCVTGRSEGAWETVYVTLLPNGLLQLEGKTMDAAGLLKKLKSMCATVQTCIEISIPEETPTPTLAALTQPLASAGYRKIQFVTPRKVVTVIEGEATARKIPASTPAQPNR